VEPATWRGAECRINVRTFERPLYEAELRWLCQMIQDERAAIESLRRGLTIVGVLGFGVLAVLILWLARVSWLIAVPFAAITSLGICVWAYVDEARKHKFLREFFSDALVHNVARVAEIKAKSMIEIEEFEDEGATFAFQVEENSILFISGQEFYSNEWFPNSHFSIVEILNSTGKLAKLLIETQGQKLTPLRTIKKHPKNWADWPEHLQLVEGKLEDLERVLFKP
jgi:hypothetical protein